MVDTTDEKESLARAHLPYRAEYCKTSRARCKRCDGLMEEDSLKLANLVKSRFHDGHDALFYHLNCFFQVKRPKSVAEIRHFETLRYEDQKMLEEAIETNGRSILGTGDQENSKGGDKHNNGFNYEDFLVEYAKSNRSKCNLCDQRIDKDSVRLGKMDYEAENQWGSGPIPRWFHVECFVKSMSQLEFYGNVKELPDFDDLDTEDQRFLIKQVKSLKRPIQSNGEQFVEKKRAKKGVKKEVETSEEDRLLQIQSDRFFELRSVIATMKRKDIELMLRYMNQKSHHRNISILTDIATDVLLFGPIEKCPECKKPGGMMLRGSTYICTNSTEWSPCNYESREPRRGVPYFPQDLLDQYEFLENGYRFMSGKRIFSSKFIKAVEAKEAEVNETVVEGAPLDGLTIGIIAWKALKKSKTEIQKKVTMLGGKVTTALDRTVFVILSSEKELANKTPKIEVAKELGVPFATEEFLFRLGTKNDVVRELSECLIEKWEGDLQERFSRMNVNQLKDNLKSRAKSSAISNIYKSSRVPKSQSLVVKNGTAVDPDSNLAEVGVVYRRGKEIYSVVLNNIDVSKDKNSFYKLQVIEHETRKEYYVYRSWGRIGCEVGGSTCKEMDDAEEAVETFENVFQEKTGNSFNSLVENSFHRYPGLYFPIEIDYSDPTTDNDVKLEYDVKSDLDRPIQELISIIFDIQRMQRAMKRFELDAEKMPLGKLSGKHILSAMETLKELQEELEVKTKKPRRRKLIALTNKFYSFIPQSFGDGQVELISSLDQVDEKNKMLSELQEIEVAYKMCSTVKENTEELVVDQYYLKLGCGITVLERDSKTFTLVDDYLQKTHAITHNNYKMSIRDIFAIERDADTKRFNEFKNLDRHLLWHGSRVTNFAGILSQGLRIAPPEAPTTGYMFGKGMYFADMSSKAANYCMADPGNPSGLLLLCEVGIGKTYDLLQSNEQLPKGLPDTYDSVRGIGKSTTDPKSHRRIQDNVLVPVGKQMPNKNGSKSQLLYNEYVIYKESQAKLRYIVRVEFKF